MLDQQEASMTAMFDFRTIRDIIAYPIRFVLGEDSGEFATRDHASRRPIIMRWRRGEDGKLESHWGCED
jgi:hypothetical protein